MPVHSALADMLGLSQTAWALAAIASSVALLTLLIAWGRVQPLLAFVVAAMAAALLLGMPAATIPKAIEKGVGDLLGSLTIIVCLGAVFGKLVADSGAARQIAVTLIRVFGSARMPIALTLTGFVVGIPLYYNVGFVLLVPLIFSLVYHNGSPAVALGIPLLAGLSIAHGFLPPHPSPTALVQQFHADMGMTLFYGIIVALPTLIIAGPLFALTLKKIPSRPAAMFEPTSISQSELPGVLNSFFSALLPVMLLALTTGLALAPLSGPAHHLISGFFAAPAVVMLMAYGAAVFSLGLAHGKTLPHIMKGAEQALRDIAPILLIIAGAGALKQVFIDSGVGTMLGLQMARLPVPPLVLWCRQLDLLARQRFRILDVQGVFRYLAEGHVSLLVGDGDVGGLVRAIVCHGAVQGHLTQLSLDKLGTRGYSGRHS